MRYEGYNGQIEIQDDTVVITREGRLAKAAFGKNVPPRRIPLQAISGIRSKEASRLGNGWIQLLLGGVDKPAPTAGTAAGDPDVVLFTHGKRDSFEELKAWLLTVVTKNQADGVDPAVVDFDEGHGRQTRLAAKQQELGEKLEAQKIETSGPGGERPDIAAAAARMGWKLGGRRELKRLPEHLYDNEQVRFIAQGTYDKNQGIVVLTDQRLVFVFHGMMSQAIEDFPLDRISSVATKAGMVTGELTVHASGNNAVISQIVKADLKLLVEALRQRLADGSGAAPAMQQAAQTAQPDVMDQLRKLAELRDAGILTTEEFDAKKAELLRRL
jgi:hypothetical protein